MATLLEELLDSFEDVIEDDIPQEKVSLWVKTSEIYTPSPDVEVKSVLPPGTYVAEYDSSKGYYCKELKTETDELFLFSESISENLLAEIRLFWSKKDLYAEHKLLHKRGILLVGYPGTGKSSYINMICKDLIKDGGVVFKINGVRNLSNYVDFMKYSFRKIQPDTHVITILEDIDQYEDVETELLDFLDGQFHLNHHVVIATSNNTEDIPDTFLRPSRLDLKIEVPLPTKRTRKEYFTYKKISEDILDSLVDLTDKCSLADLKEIYTCIAILDYSVERAVDQIKNPYEKKNYLEKQSNKKKISL